MATGAYKTTFEAPNYAIACVALYENENLPLGSNIFYVVWYIIFLPSFLFGEVSNDLVEQVVYMYRCVGAEKRNSSALAMELRHSLTNPSVWNNYIFPTKLRYP